MILRTDKKSKKSLAFLKQIYYNRLSKVEVKKQDVKKTRCFHPVYLTPTDDKYIGFFFMSLTTT